MDEVQGFIISVLLSLTTIHPHGDIQSLLGLESQPESVTQSCLIIYPEWNAVEIDEMNDYHYPELTRIRMLNDVAKLIFKKMEVHSGCVTLLHLKAQLSSGGNVLLQMFFQHLVSRKKM